MIAVFDSVSYADAAAYTTTLAVSTLAFAVLVVLNLATPRRCAVWALTLVTLTFGLACAEGDAGQVCQLPNAADCPSDAGGEGAP